MGCERRDVVWPHAHMRVLPAARRVWVDRVTSGAWCCVARKQVALLTCLMSGVACQGTGTAGDVGSG